LSNLKECVLVLGNQHATQIHQISSTTCLHYLINSTIPERENFNENKM